MISQRQFFRTLQTCQMVEDAIRQAFPNIRNLSVFIDRNAEASSSLTVSYDASTADEMTIARFIDSLPPYIR